MKGMTLQPRQRTPRRNADFSYMGLSGVGVPLSGCGGLQRLEFARHSVQPLTSSIAPKLPFISARTVNWNVTKHNGSLLWAL